MLTRNQWLLIKLAEECAEVTQRATKALTFGIAEVQKGQELNNSERMLEEILDFCTIVLMLEESGTIAEINSLPNLTQRINQRKAKVEKWYEYAKEEGQVL